MRLRPVLKDELDELHRWWTAPGPRFRPTPDDRLTALRRRVYDDAVAAISAGRPIKVSTYVLAETSAEAEAAHALLAASARDRGWFVHRQHFTDAPPNGPLPAQPQFHLACRHAGAGFVDGVLAIDRGAMPSTDEAYESYLHWLHRHFAFVAFLKPPLGGTPWTDQ